VAGSLESAKRLLRLLGPLLLALILSRIDIGGVMRRVSTVQLPLLAIAVLLYPLLVMLKAWRWRLLLRQQGVDYAMGPAFLAYNSGLAAGYVTPGRVGELIKALYLRNDKGLTTGRALSSVVLERVLDLYALLATAVAGIVLIAMPRALFTLSVPVLLVAGLGPLLILLPFIRRRLMGVMDRAATHFVPGRYKEDVAHSLNGFQSGMDQLLVMPLVLPLAITVISYLVFYGQCYLVALSLGLPMAYGFVAFCVSLGSLMALLPISVAGLGVRDIAFITVFGTKGLAPELAISYSLLFLLVFNVFGGAIGALAWLAKPL
jgi:uncharacterized protein (TIRG00374 family)